MPRYFFHIRQGSDWIEDFEGTELIDLSAAILDAVMSAQEIVSDRLRKGETSNTEIFEISNGDGVVLAELPFSDVYKA